MKIQLNTDNHIDGTDAKERNMGLIVFSMSHSLDGYITDAEGRFDWGAPDEHIFRAALEEVRRGRVP